MQDAMERIEIDSIAPMTGAPRSTRVVKKIAPNQPGAVGWARKYGGALVCVRYRLDPSGRRRYTTVELLVDEAPTQHRADFTPEVAVRLDFEELQLRQHVKAAGGRWDADQNVWRLSQRQAKRLGLLRRVVRDKEEAKVD